jgi:tetratricopeptide (TPR) repeat protein
MKPATLALLLATAAAPAAAWAQDKIIPNDGATIEGRVTKLSCKEISYEFANNPGIPQSMAMNKVRDIEFENSTKPFELQSAEDMVKRGEYKEAIDKFNRVLRDGKTEQPHQEMARWGVVQCWLGMNDGARAVEAITNFRKDAPEWYFTRDAYTALAQFARETGDAKLLQTAMQDFDAAGKSLGMTDWSKSVELIKAGVLESQGNFKEAGALYQKYAGESKSEVGIDANLGLMRSLAGAANWTALKSKSDDILGTPKGKDTKLLMGAYVGRGLVLLNDKKNKEALLEFMRVIDVLTPKLGELTQSFEAALYHGAIACARYATESKDAEQKNTYKNRAMELFDEAKKRFDRSPLAKAAQDEIKAIK